MSVSIKISDAGFANYVALNMPYQDGLEGWYMPKDGNASMIKNWAPSKHDATLLAASPVYDGESATVAISSKIDTGIVVGLDWTFVALMKPGAGHCLMISSSNVPGGTGSGDSIVSFNSGDGNPKFQALAGIAVGGVVWGELTKAALGLDNDQYAFICGTANAGNVFLHVGKNGALVSSQGMAANRVSTPAPIYIAGNAQNYAAPFQGSMFGIWSKQRTQDEVLALYKYLRQLFASLHNGAGLQ